MRPLVALFGEQFFGKLKLVPIVSADGSNVETGR